MTQLMPRSFSLGIGAEQRLKGEEFDVGAGLAEEVNAVGIVGMFHGNALPDVGRPRQFVVELGQAFGAFGEDLVAMPVGLVHHVKDFFDETERHVPVVEVAHGVDEDGLGTFPAEREAEGVFVKGDLEAVTVMRVADSLEAVGHALGVAMLAARADLGAPRHGVPSCFGPFD